MSHDPPIVVNGLSFPRKLAAALESGLLRAWDGQSMVQELGLGRPLVTFFPLDYVTGDLAAEWLGVPSEYRGVPGLGAGPGDIDPARSIVFGEVDSDCPLALDYRSGEPRVVALAGDRPPHWIQVAATVGEFLDLVPDIDFGCG